MIRILFDNDEYGFKIDTLNNGVCEVWAKEFDVEELVFISLTIPQLKEVLVGFKKALEILDGE